MRRLILEILIVSVVIALAWERPLNRFLPGEEPEFLEVEPVAEDPEDREEPEADKGGAVERVEPSPKPTPTPTPTASWMFDSERVTPLDHKPSPRK